jgi:exosortase
MSLKSGVSRNHATFAVLALLPLAFLVRPAAALLGSAELRDERGLVVVVVFVCIGLIWQDRARIAERIEFSPAALVVLLPLFGCFFGLATLSGLDGRLYVSLSTLLLAVWCIAGFRFAYGAAAFRRARFPLLLLVAMTPLPAFIESPVIGWLQKGSAEAAGWLFQAANVPFHRDGIVLTLPRVTIEVARECSGIRSTLVLLVATLVMGHILLHSSWAKILLVLLLVPMSIFKNVIRIFTLSMLGMYLDPSFLTGKLHHNGGVVFFALAFVGMGGLAVLLRYLEPREVGTSAHGSQPALAAKDLP